MKDLKKGERVSIRAYKSLPGKGLSYPSFTAILLDDANSSEGWDVVDTRKDDGTEQSIYCFSIVRE